VVLRTGEIAARRRVERRRRTLIDLVGHDISIEPSRGSRALPGHGREVNLAPMPCPRSPARRDPELASGAKKIGPGVNYLERLRRRASRPVLAGALPRYPDPHAADRRSRRPASTYVHLAHSPYGVSDGWAANRDAGRCDRAHCRRLRARSAVACARAR
jgi:hypothetical protein